jgi:NTE family protein
LSFSAPDVLVLGGGGILGEAWMNAVLAGIEEASGFDARGCEDYVGTSAGSIVAAALAGGMSPEQRLGGLPSQPPAAEDETNGHDPGLAGRAVRAGMAAGAAVAAPVASLALASSAPGGALARRIALGRMPQGRRSLGGMGREIDRMGARFDGRLAVSALDLGSGRRVMFGRPEAPAASVGEAVEASCAIPGFFRPVSIGGRSYVDGGAWSPTNMDAARVSRGTRVLCLNPTGSMAGSVASAMGAIGLASRSLARVEALVLERRGARVSLVAPDEASVQALGPNLMDPRPRRRVVDAGFAQGRRLGSDLR